MIQEVYDWLESRTGSPYDFRDEISELDISDAFLTPIDWYNEITITIDRLEECVEDINTHQDEIPDYLPNHVVMKKLMIEETTELLLQKLNEVKSRLGIKQVRVKDAYDLVRQCSMMSKIIDLCKNTKIGQIISVLTKFEEDNGNFLMDEFDITPKDYSQLYSDITDIVSDFEENDY